MLCLAVVFRASAQEPSPAASPIHIGTLKILPNLIESSPALSLKNVPVLDVTAKVDEGLFLNNSLDASLINDLEKVRLFKSWLSSWSNYRGQPHIAEDTLCRWLYRVGYLSLDDRIDDKGYGWPVKLNLVKGLAVNGGFRGFKLERFRLYPDVCPLSIDSQFNVVVGGFGAFLRGFSGGQCNHVLPTHQVGLSFDPPQSPPSNHCIHYRDVYDDPVGSCKPWQRFFWGCVLTIVGFWLAAVNGGERWVNNNMRWWDWPLSLVGLITCCMGATILIFGHAWPPKQECSENSDNRQPFQHNAEIVPHKHLGKAALLGYINRRGLVMANVLNMDKQIIVIGALAEGSSIRSIERMSGIHRDTIMRLGVKVGQGCTSLMDAKMRGLSCNRLEMDEIWGFVGKKERHVREGDAGVGSVWTFCAIDAQTKLVPAFMVGERDAATANAFLADVASRVEGRVQISTDGLAAYKEAIEKSFGADADYGQIIKTYGHTELTNNRRYSAPEFVSSEKKIIAGSPDYDLISTSYVERLNATTRLHMRRLTRLTLAFSKKRENFEAAVGLHFGYYNFVKRHNTLRCTPAMAAGVTSTFWGVGDLVEAAA